MRLGAIFFNSIAFSVQLHKEIQQTVVVRFIFHSVPISVVSPTLQRIINVFVCVCLIYLSLLKRVEKRMETHDDAWVALMLNVLVTGFERIQDGADEAFPRPYRIKAYHDLFVTL